MRAAGPFDAPHLAQGYASARPPLHARILARALRAAGSPRLHEVGFDSGCGAGLSTRAMLPHVSVALAADPVLSMVRQAAACVPEARFFAARMESLPLNDGCCRLMTAAGSLNYTDVPAALREAARVLSPGGLLIVYDFAPGKRFGDDKSLEKWFDAFLGRHPKPADGAAALDPPALRALAGGFFQPLAESTIEEREIYDAPRYAAYMMTETNAAAAIRAGERAAAIRQWMDETLPAVFGERPREVLFDAYFAVFAKPSSSSTRAAP